MGLTDGTSPVDYLEAYDIMLFLSLYPDDVSAALRKGKSIIRVM